MAYILWQTPNGMSVKANFNPNIIGVNWGSIVKISSGIKFKCKISGIV